MTKRAPMRVICLAMIALSMAACGMSQPSATPAPPTPVPVPTETAVPACTRQPTPDIIEHMERPYAADLRTISTDYVEGEQCIRIDGGPNRKCVRVRVRSERPSRLISTQEELREWFAPIESAEEALTYAMIATGYSAKYDPEDYRLGVTDNCDPGPEFYLYFTDVLEDTHVVEVINGYHVYLFDSVDYGCGPFPVSSVIVEVAFDGALSEFPMVRLFQQGQPCPGEKMVQCCID